MHVAHTQACCANLLQMIDLQAAHEEALKELKASVVEAIERYSEGDISPEGLLEELHVRSWSVHANSCMTQVLCGLHGLLLPSCAVNREVMH